MAGIMEVFLLVGQSNMAGRGALTAISNDRVPLANNSFCFSAMNKWEEAFEPMHKDIDLRKVKIHLLICT